MFTQSRRTLIMALFFVAFLVILEGIAAPLRLFGEGSLPPRPRILEASLAPAAARLLQQVALSYDPGLTPRDRDRDFLKKAALARNSLGIHRLVELRRKSLELLAGKGEVSWETLRLLKWPDGDRVGVLLSVPVWVPAGARRLVTYCGFAKKWQTVALTAPRPCGYIWHVETLSAINAKDNYRADYIHFEVNSKFAPLAALLLEYIFREGWYEPQKRVPLLVVRGGEDTYAVSVNTGPGTVESLSFPDQEGTSLEAQVIKVHFDHLAQVYHGRHAVISNHRLGLALDLNDFNFSGVVDGPPNPVSRALRQYNREAMHRLDARQLPSWIYTVAKWLGCRLPQEWNYVGYHTDWPHLDVGTK
uniref:Uncharacterized protein n=1 Tax=Desulfobacca acetoxidans TaxID=60893 RepID=A0A7C5EV59_9BACT